MNKNNNINIKFKLSQFEKYPNIYNIELKLLIIIINYKKILLII